MKTTIIIAFLILTCSLCSFAQDTAKAERFVNEGIQMHDGGKYSEAIALYQKALDADADHLRALYEMSYTYSVLGKNDSTIFLCKKLISLHAPDNILMNAYVTLGSAYDDLKQSDKAEETYKEGISRFPDFYLLYFNLGVTYLFEKPMKDEEALPHFQKAVTLHPFHASSHYWQYKLLADGNKIPAVLAACMLCIAEQNTERSKACAAFIQKTLTPDIKSDSAKKNITINISSSALSGKQENNFSVPEIGISIMATSPINDSLHLDTDEKKLSFQMQSLFNFLSYDKKNKGFYWTFYAPFFYQLKQKEYTDVLVNIILMNSETYSDNWVTDHKDKVNEFYGWAKDFAWNKKMK